MKKIAFSILVLFVPLLLFAQNREVKHIVLIGSDGFSSAVVRENPGAFPNIERLIQEGSHTLEKRSVLPSSSAVNWASMLMGAGPELHGYTTWGSQTPELPSRVIGEDGIFPSIVRLIRNGYPDAKIGLGYTWATIGCLYEQKAADLSYNSSTEAVLKDSICLWIRENKPLFTFLAFDEPDHTGHESGWESEEYVNMCKIIDGYVGEIMQTLKDTGMIGNTLVVFTSDHGGINKGHGGKTMNEMEAPFILWGPGIKKSFYITDSVMIYDTASTIAYVLGLEQPQVWIGRPVVSAFEK